MPDNEVDAVIGRQVALEIDGKIAEWFQCLSNFPGRQDSDSGRSAAVGAKAEGILSPGILPCAKAPAESKLPPESTTCPWKPA